MRNYSRFFHNFLLLLLSLLITLSIFVGSVYLYVDSQLPDINALRSVQLPIPLRIYTQDGQLLYEFGEAHRSLVKLQDVPPLMIDAFIATEDRRFYAHHGVDFLGLLRATTALVLTGQKVEGGSTITMQLVRNFFLSREKTYLRKFTEILLALKIEQAFTKNQILELYLNKIFLGNRAWGVGAAADIYYGKKLKDLTLPQIAVIAGLPKAPSAINPFANPTAAKKRRDHVLMRMLDLGYIDKKTYEVAQDTPILSGLRKENFNNSLAPYVSEMVRETMSKSFGDEIYTKGYNVYTTLITQQQIAANNAVRDALINYDKRHGYRGPQKNLGRIDPERINFLLSTLQQAPIINGLLPALVIDMGDKSITTLLSNGHIILIPWSGLKWARPALVNGGVGPIPSSAHAITAVGDLIYVEEINKEWELSQPPKIQGALVALSPQTGAITALVGGFDYAISKFNRVKQAQRQVGSNIKPFLYAAALAKGYTLATIVNDAPIVFNIPGRSQPWRPQNDTHTFNGPTRLRTALAFSINLVTIRLLQAIGVNYAINYLLRFGFESDRLPPNLSLALGTNVITPLELARSYAVFANGGYLISPYIIDHITNSKGEIIYQAQPKIACQECLMNNGISTDPNKQQLYAPQVIPADIAFLITSGLKDVINFGTGHDALVLGRHDLAGKTGTTNDYMDTWFSGFNNALVTTVWVGFDQPNSIHEYGAKAALPLWINFMRAALQNTPESTLPQPSNIVSASIDPSTGEIVPPDTLGAIPELFRKDVLATQPITIPDTINKDNVEEEAEESLY